MQLVDLGYEPVGTATSGEQAIEMAVQLRPDLVLMDIHLATAMDGSTLPLAIRCQFDLPCLFLIVFQGDNLARAKITEPVGYLAKPFTDYELQKVVEDAFKKR